MVSGEWGSVRIRDSRGGNNMVTTYIKKIFKKF